jgi:hypothetical protein
MIINLSTFPSIDIEKIVLKNLTELKGAVEIPLLQILSARKEIMQEISPQASL